MHEPRSIAGAALVCCAAACPAQARWSALNPAAGPSARTAHVMVELLPAGALLFGGHDGVAYSNETWEWRAGTWLARTPARAPSPRTSSGIANDVARGRVVLFGGSDGTVPLLADTWEWDGSTWVDRTGSGPAPSGRWGPGMAYDPGRARVLLFGGRGGTPIRSLDDTWEWDGTTWSRVFPRNVPPARSNFGMVYDWARGEIVLFGGAVGSATNEYNDTWTYDGTDWHRRAPSRAPAQRRFFAMAYDHQRRRVVVYGGGRGTPANPIYDDTWEWDGQDWWRREKSSPPGMRYNMAMASDGLLGGVVLFGVWSQTATFGDPWWFSTDAPATFSTFGTPCIGQAGPTVAARAGQLPWIGTKLTVDVLGLTLGQPATVLLGASDSTWGGRALPLDLSGLGMAGCRLLVSPDLALPLLVAAGRSSVVLGIPENPWLAGRSVFLQAAAVAPGQNALGVLMSNGGRLGFGAR